jgi:Clostripain family
MKLRPAGSLESGGRQGGSRPAVLLSTVAAFALHLGGMGPASAGPNEWSILAYLSGDSSLEAAMLEYVDQLRAVPSGGGVGIAVQLDRVGGYSARDGDEAGTRRFLLRASAPGRPRERADSGWRAEVDMGDPQSLVDFVQWAAGKCPARHYLLLVAGHGSGVRALQPDEESKRPPSGVAYDATSRGDSLTPSELGGACRRIAGMTGGRVSVLAVDACFSATVELGCEVAPSVECLTGSPGLLYEPGTPWDCVGRKVVESPTMPATEAAKAVVEAIRQRQEQSGNPRGSYIAADLTRMGDLQAKSGQVVRELQSRMRELAPAITLARSQTWTTGLHMEMAGLSRFLRALARAAEGQGEGPLAQKAVDAADAADATLLDGFAAPEETCRSAPGWAVFFPPSLTAFPGDYLETGTFARDAGWGSFLSAYLGHLRALVTPAAQSASAAGA